MKITFLSNQYARISGGNRALFEYANRLSDMGHQVRWVVLAKPVKWYRFLEKMRSGNNGMVTLAPETIDWIPNKIPIELMPKNEARYVPEADILLATAWQTAEFAATLPDDKGKKFYFVQHHESLWTREKDRAERTYHLPFRKIVISSWLKEVLQAKGLTHDIPVLVTPVNPEDFYCHDKIWNTPPKICMLHHDYDWKGYAEGLAAIRELRSRNLEFNLVVFGEKMEDPGPLYSEAGFIFEYHFRPTRETLRKIYSSCDIYLCPSWYEGLGMPAMEAMACRCALVTTDTGGCRDYALDGETALVSPPKNIGHLADNLAALIQDKDLLKRLSENGQRKIEEFRWDENCRKLVQLFEKNL